MMYVVEAATDLHNRPNKLSWVIDGFGLRLPGFEPEHSRHSFSDFN